MKWFRYLPLLLLAPLAGPAAESAPPNGWLSWRGPEQGGVSRETGFPKAIQAEEALWTVDLPGQSTPVIHNGRLYINGFIGGNDANLQEVVACLDAETGERLWDHRENDFLSDIIYLRYATSSPSIDPETGNVYVQFTQGMLAAFTPEGRLLWRHSLMEAYGRLTFPNARTASPVIDRELVITRGVTSSWGAHGPAGDRFYAFDKRSGDLVWSSAPGGRPQDNTFSQPYLDIWQGRRVLYTAAGDSTLMGINARNGEPLWRFSFAKAGAKGGINSALVRWGDYLVGIHESENLDSSEIGRMAAFRIPDTVQPPSPIAPQVFEAADLEVWRNHLGTLASSPVVVGDTIYVVTGFGDLAAVDAPTGEVLWRRKLGIEQRQSSPFYADGLLYIGMYISAEGAEAALAGTDSGGSSGDFFVLRPSREGVEELSRTRLDGRCFGSPVGYNGRIYVQTDKRLYCFGKAGDNPQLASVRIPQADWPAAGEPAALQIIPYEVRLKPGRQQAFRVRVVDAHGFVVEESVDPARLRWEPYIPPTALVRATLNASFDAAGRMQADSKPVPSAGQFRATYRGADGRELVGYVKGRVLPDLPMFYDFEEFELSNTTTNTVEPPTAFAYPPLPWNSARMRFEVRDAPMDDRPNKALVKTVDNKLFQRGQVFIGHPEMRNYTIEADVLSEGNRRKMSEVGLINQRYLILLKGNSQQIEVNSNQERIKQAVNFRWNPNEWYRLKARVDVAADGSGVVRAKAWKRGDPEPEGWNIEVPHRNAHPEGAPGIFGFAPQDQRVAIDNIRVTAN